MRLCLSNKNADHFCKDIDKDPFFVKNGYRKEFACEFILSFQIATALSVVNVVC